MTASRPDPANRLNRTNRANPANRRTVPRSRKSPAPPVFSKTGLLAKTKQTVPTGRFQKNHRSDQFSPNLPKSPIPPKTAISTKTHRSTIFRKSADLSKISRFHQKAIFRKIGQPTDFSKIRQLSRFSRFPAFPRFPEKSRPWTFFRFSPKSQLMPIFQQPRHFPTPRHFCQNHPAQHFPPISHHPPVFPRTPAPPTVTTKWPVYHIAPKMETPGIFPAPTTPTTAPTYAEHTNMIKNFIDWFKDRHPHAGTDHRRHTPMWKTDRHRRTPRQWVAALPFQAHAGAAATPSAQRARNDPSTIQPTQRCGT